MYKCRFSSTNVTSDPISIWIFAARSEVVNPFSCSHKSLVLISFWIGIRSFETLFCMGFSLSKHFLLGLLLFLFQDSHLIGPCHIYRTIEIKTTYNRLSLTISIGVCRTIPISSLFSKQNPLLRLWSAQAQNAAKETQEDCFFVEGKSPSSRLLVHH